MEIERARPHLICIYGGKEFLFDIGSYALFSDALWIELKEMGAAHSSEDLSELTCPALRHQGVKP